MTRDLFGADQDPRYVFSISELNEQIKDLLETAFPSVWVSGEISNFSKPQSGHCYLTLKDDRAQIRAVIWKTAASRVRFDLHDGLEVLCHGSIDLYAPRGSYQLVIQHIQPKGMGALELALRKLRDRLSAEGLFDPDLKRPLPRFPRRIAVVTSPTGAAICDFLEVLRRRYRGIEVLVVPVRVQGPGAAQEIAAAIGLVNRLPRPVDCLLVTRGGGSLEDLWAFNEEVVVRAIHASRVPVVSAVGHEIDVTLSDLAADVRALTPSEAAELISPSGEELAATLARQQQRLLTALRTRVGRARSWLDAVSDCRAFRRPLERVHHLQRRLDELDACSKRAVERRVQRAKAQVAQAAGQLEALSPLGVLSRGYSLTQRSETGELIRDAATLVPGDEISTRFSRGQAISRVQSIHPDPQN